MAKLKDDQIQWILSLDAKGVQSEITSLSSRTKDLTKENKFLEAELKAVNKQMLATQKEMDHLEKAGKGGSKAFKELEATMESATHDAAEYTKRISENSRHIKENNRLTDEMIKTLRIEEMTMDQLRKQAKALENQLEHTSEAAEPEQYERLDKQLRAVRDRMGELKTGSNSMMSVFKGGLMVMVGNLLTKGVDKIKEWLNDTKEFVKEGINMARSAEGTITAFNKLSDSNRILKEMKKSTSETISEMELMKKTLRANELGIPIEHMAELMDYARRQALKLGKDVNYMSDSIVDGIGRKSTLVLDNLGISATRVQAQVKKSGDFTQAVMKIVSDDLAKAGDAALTGADKAAQSAAKWENAQLKVGRKFQWLGDLWDEISGNMADNVAELMGETDNLTDRYQKQIEKVADLETNAYSLAKRYDELKGKTSLNKDEQTELNRIMNTLANTVPGVISEFDQYGNILSINTDKVYEYVKAQKAKLKVINSENIEEQTQKLKGYNMQMKILQKELSSGQVSYMVPTGRGGSSVQYRNMTYDEYIKKKEEYDEIAELAEGTQAYLNDLNGTTLEEQIANQKALNESRAKFNKMNKDELKAWIADEKNASDQYIEIARQTYRQRFGGNDSDPDPQKSLQKQKKFINKRNEEMETAHREKLADIKQKYLDGDIKSESEFNRKIFSQEQAYSLLREKALKDFLKNVTDAELKSDINNQIAALQDQRLTQQVNYQKELEKIILESDPYKKEKARYEHQLRELDLFGKSKQEMLIEQIVAETDEEKNLIQQRIEVLEALEKQHQDNMFQIREQENNRKKAQSERQFEDDFKERKDEMQKELNELMVQAQAKPQSFEAEMSVHIQRLKMIQEEIAARNNAGVETSKQFTQLGRAESQMTASIQKENTRRVQIYSQYANSIGTAFGNFFAGQTSALEAFGGTMIDILFDILGKIVEQKIMEATAVAIAEQAKAAAIAAAAPDSVMSFGATAAFRTAAITALITGALTAAKTALKALISNKNSGSSRYDSGKKNTHNQRVVSGYAEGGHHYEGYTGSGDTYDVKGYFDDGQPFHAGEYIIPKWMMPLPNVAPVVRHLETIRRQKSNSNPMPNGYAEGGHHDDVEPMIANNGLIKELIDTMKELRDKKLDFNIYEFERKKSTADNARKLASRR